MATSIEFVNSLFQNAQQLLGELNDLQNKAATAQAGVKMAQDQYNKHEAGSQGQADAKKDLDNAISTYNQADSKVKAKQAQYDVAKKEYLDSLNQLSTDQKKQLSDQQAAQTNIDTLNAQANLAQSSTAVFSQKNTQYLIIGGIVILVGVMIFWGISRMKKGKAAAVAGA